MAFQRSYSKVWWGSDDNQLLGRSVMNPSNQHLLSLTNGGLLNSHSTQKSFAQQQQQHKQQQYQHFGGVAYHSLDINQCKSYSGNLSRIQEVEEEHNISKLSWKKNDSPGSLKSQDSGFSDNEELHSNRSMSSRSSKTSSASNKSTKSSHSDISSPTSLSAVKTPPTVIRRITSTECYTPLVNISRRISLSCSASPKIKNTPTKNAEGGSYLMTEIDSMKLMTEFPLAKKLNFDEFNGTENCQSMSPIMENNSRIKRRRKVQRKATTPLSATYKISQKFNDKIDKIQATSDFDTPPDLPEYNNETVYLVGKPTCSTPPPPYNNETVVLGGKLEYSDSDIHELEAQNISPLRLRTRLSGNTSTPKSLYVHKPDCTLPCQDHENTQLNGHSEDVQIWLDDLRTSYNHEVMFTLQTKSIAQEAFKNLQITTSTVTKFIRQMQQKAASMQAAFDRVERILSGGSNISLHDSLANSLQLLDHVSEFTLILDRRSVFFADSRLDRKRYNDYLDQIRMVNKDTRYSLEHNHYIKLESLLEDLQVLKRILLISIQQVYEKLVRVLVTSIENGRCDLLLKANINMISTIMSINYDGFASLSSAFVRTEAVRTLLVVCLEHKMSSVRAQALRALTTVCCAPEPIAQLDTCGGIEIIRDILQADSCKKQKNSLKRDDTERREAVSLLTQITASWHGTENKVSGLKGCVETIVEGLTQIFVFTECPQTLLLCTAALNNLSRMEVTSHYSIMSHETIFKLIFTIDQKAKGINVFLCEQIVGMMYNMSLNKKCHSHLANTGIINFITYAYEKEFYKTYNSRGESEAQTRCIKTILHTLTRLVQDSVLAMELLEQQKHIPLPLFFKLNTTQDAKQHLSTLDEKSNSIRDISFLTHQLLHKSKQYCDAQSQQQQQHQVLEEITEEGKKLKMQLQRQESYV